MFRSCVLTWQFSQLVEHLDRPQVGEEPQLFSDLQQPGFGARLGRRVGPFRSADGAQQDRVRSAAGFDGFFRQRVSGFIDRDATDFVRLKGEFMTEDFGDFLEDASGLLGDFGADAVAGQQNDRGFQGFRVGLRNGEWLCFDDREPPAVGPRANCFCEPSAVRPRANCGPGFRRPGFSPAAYASRLTGSVLCSQV